MYSHFVFCIHTLCQRNLYSTVEFGLKKPRDVNVAWMPCCKQKLLKKLRDCRADCSALLLNQNCSVDAEHCVSGTCDEQVVQHYFGRRIKAGARCFYDAKKHGPLKNRHSHYWLIHFELALHHILHPF